MLKAKRKTGLVFFPAFDWAISPTHPEREERLLYTQDQVFEEGLLDIDGILEYKPDPVSVRDVERVHFCVPNVHAVMTESHFISAGGAKTIGMAVMNRHVERGFALVRPPGHHAMRMVHGARGFCNINIEAIMIESLRTAFDIRRVAIVDTDCHHGDGTQDIYWHDPDTLFISIHQDGRTLYPGSGFLNELGGPNAVGTTLNLPLPPHTSAEGILYTVDQVITPILNEFQPELIINSAGQDNHYSDPITNMNFSAQGYAALTEKLGADIAVLEGGYSIEGALPYVNVGIILAMAGLEYRHVIEPDYDAQKIAQSSQTTQWVKGVCEKALEVWAQRHQLQDELCSGKDFIERPRSIFYDTDNIAEEQREVVRVCRRCAGALRIESASSRRGRVLALHIPRLACEQCTSLAYQWYDSAEKESFSQVMLQDRPKDQYVVQRL